MAHYSRVPCRALITPRVRELSSALVRQLKQEMRAQNASRDQAEAAAAKVSCQIFDEAVAGTVRLRDDDSEEN